MHPHPWHPGSPLFALPCPCSPTPAFSCLDSGLASSQGSLASRAQGSATMTTAGACPPASSQVKSCPAGELPFSPHGPVCSTRGGGRGFRAEERQELGTGPRLSRLPRAADPPDLLPWCHGNQAAREPRWQQSPGVLSRESAW